ncbi:MAG TPA: alpha-D-ribose 1-methylphosphonate 5-triphosphate diphosphatase [Methylomirabilota bacterium]|nr:alpha-D-ribose 1-methylphosphonate 5-triphosphate diphosphatase [Methylomirabilota bacterium]
MSELVFTNARIVTAEAVVHGTLRVVDGTIAEVQEGTSVASAAVDLDGDYLLPGLVELHTDVLERHAFPRPGVAWPPVAAALAYDAELTAAGITTVLDSLAIGYVFDSGRRPRDPRPLVDAVGAARDAKLLRADHFLHLRCEVSTEQVVEDFERLVGDPSVRLVSLMDHTPGQRQFVDVGKYREYNQGKYGLSDAQVEALIVRRLEDQQRYGVKHRAAIVARCHERGHALASHDDATRVHVDEAAMAGAVIAEFPTTLDAAAAAHAIGLAVLAGAPNLVCGKSHSGNISVATLATAGLLDILSSDYVPASLLHGAFVLEQLGMPLPAALATVTSTPAHRVGLKDRGAIAPGLRADLVRARATRSAVAVSGVWRDGRRVA